MKSIEESGFFRLKYAAHSGSKAEINVPDGFLGYEENRAKWGFSPQNGPVCLFLSHGTTSKGHGESNQANHLL